MIKANENTTIVEVISLQWLVIEIISGCNGHCGNNHTQQSISATERQCCCLSRAEMYQRVMPDILTFQSN